MNQTVFILGALVAGFCIALQAPANSRLRGYICGSGPMTLHHSLYAAFFSICGTFLSVVLAMLVVRPAAPTWASLRQTEWWNWIGGPLGAMFVFAGALLISELGAALFVALVVGGQLTCSLILDHFGLMGLPQHSISLGRLLGAAMVLAGVVCLKYL